MTSAVVDVMGLKQAAWARLAPVMSRVHGHAQTVAVALPFGKAAITSATKTTRVEHASLPIPEGGVLVARCAWQQHDAPAVVVCHGVGGSSEDLYVLRASTALANAGFHVLRLNVRGGGLGRGLARRLSHAALGEDVELAVRFLEGRGIKRVGVLGFSLGGHIALCHAADVSERGESGALAAIATVSAPVDLAETMRRFSQRRHGLTGVYERLIVRSLVDKARALLRRSPTTLPFSSHELAQVRTISAFDDTVTIRMHGFTSVDTYYAHAAVGPRLAQLRIPSLMLHADNDPIVPTDALRLTARSPQVALHILPSGGHVGFVERPEHIWGTTEAVARALVHFKAHLL